MFSRITMNFVTAQKRYETLEGRQYLVVPCVMLTEGVHNGSDGPLYYPATELASDPVVWNHKPVVVYHPTLNGEGISACEPSVLEVQKVGLLFNTSFDGRLKAEAWLDEDKLRQVDPRVLDAINSGTVMEVSTGLFQDTDPTPGTWNGKPYKGTVRNIKPDHLAILPDEKGACSVADGAGLLRNQTASGELSYSDVRSQLSALLRGDPKSESYCYCYVEDVFPKYAIYEKEGKFYRINYKVKDSKVSIVGAHEEVMRLTSYITANGEKVEFDLNKSGGVYMTKSGKIIGNEEVQGPVVDKSEVMKRQQAHQALVTRYAGIQQDGTWGGSVVDLYANYVVYSDGNKLFRLPYTYAGDMITFDDSSSPEEVERVSTYRTLNDIPIDGSASPAATTINQEKNVAEKNGKPAPTGNAIHQGAHELVRAASDAVSPDAPAGKTDGETRTQAVAKMVAAGAIDAGMSAWFEKISDELFGSIYPAVMKGVNTPIQPYSYAGIGDRSSVHNQRGKPVTANEYIESAPPEIRDYLREGLAAQQAQRARLIKTITSNKANRFTEEWLKDQSTPVLSGIARLAQQPKQQQVNPLSYYGGQGNVPILMNAEDEDALTANAAGDDDDVVGMPSMDFSK